MRQEYNQEEKHPLERRCDHLGAAAGGRQTCAGPGRWESPEALMKGCRVEAGTEARQGCIMENSKGSRDSTRGEPLHMGERNRGRRSWGAGVERVFLSLSYHICQCNSANHLARKERGKREEQSLRR